MSIRIENNEIYLKADDDIIPVVRAFATYLKRVSDVYYLSIAVGYDGTGEAEEVLEKILPALIYDGVDVYDMGFTVSPALFMATLFEEFNCDGSIMVYQDNDRPGEVALKLFFKGGQLDNDQLDWVKQIAKKKEFIHFGRGSLTRSDLMKVYATTLRNHIARKTGSEDFSKMHVIAGSPTDASSFIAEEVLAPLGINTEGSDQFGKHSSGNSEEMIEDLKNRVIARKADYGLYINPDFSKIHVLDAAGETGIDFFSLVDENKQTDSAPDLFEVTASSIFNLIRDLDENRQENYPNLEEYRKQVLQDLKNYTLESETIKNVVEDDEGAQLYVLDERKKRSIHLDLFQIKDRLIVTSEEPLPRKIYRELRSFLQQYPSVDLSRLKMSR